MRIARLAVACLAALVLSTPLARAQNAQPAAVGGPDYIVSYIEVRAAAADAARAALRAYREATRKETGNTRIEVFQEVGQTNRFMIEEGWTDEAAFGAHGKGAAAKALAETLAPDLAAPVDRREHAGFSLGPAAAAPAGAIVAMTHIDVGSPRFSDLLPPLNTFAGASRKESGAIRFDILQIRQRPNHLTLLESWTDADAFDAHRMAAHTKTFRADIAPLLGALFDQRIYRRIDG